MVALLQIAALLLGADPVLTLTPDAKGAVAQPIYIKAETDGKIVKFRVPPGLNVVERGYLNDSKVLIVTSATPGQYKVEAWTAVGDVPSDIAVTVVTITGQAPPGPGPGPQPKPPEELIAALDPIYGAILGDGKQAGTLLLAKTLREFAEGEPKAKTVSSLFFELKAALVAAKVPELVQPLRGKLGNDLEALLGKAGSTPIVPESLKAVKRTLTDYANALEQIAREP